MSFLDDPERTMYQDDDVFRLHLSTHSPLVNETIVFLCGMAGVSEVLFRKGSEERHHVIQVTLDPSRPNGVTKASIIGQLSDWSTEHEVGLIGPSGRLLSTHKVSPQQKGDV